MPRIGICILLILSVVVLPGRGMATNSGSIFHQMQMFTERGKVGADEQGPYLSAGELFTISVLPEIACFDRPAQSYILVERITIAEILDDTSGRGYSVVETEPGEFEDVSFVASEAGIMALFVMALPYQLATGYYETPLPEGTLGG